MHHFPHPQLENNVTVEFMFYHTLLEMEKMELAYIVLFIYFR